MIDVALISDETFAAIQRRYDDLLLALSESPDVALAQLDQLQALLSHVRAELQTADELAAGVSSPPEAKHQTPDELAAEPVPSQVLLDAALLMQAEALLFVASEPLAISDLMRGLRLDAAQAALLLPQLRSYFHGRGIRIQQQDDRLQLVSAPEAGPLLEQFLGTQQLTRLSAAALEVLAIVAYRQPLTRAQIEAIRGVDCSGVLRSLLARELIQELGRSEALGRPIVYGTTSQFLHTFGLQQLGDLPPLELPELPQDSVSA